MFLFTLLRMIETCDPSPFPVNLREKERHTLEHLFIRPSVIARLRGGPLGPYLDDLATFLHHQGYAPSHIQRSVRAGDQCARWLHEQGALVSALDASQMVNHSASFKDVADVLGHQSLQTTGIYGKLELDALAAVALPWGGGAL
jgi:hypothetical protein